MLTVLALTCLQFAVTTSLPPPDLAPRLEIGAPPVAPLGRPAPPAAEAPLGRPRSILATGAAFLAGDLLAAGIFAGGSALVPSGEEALGWGVLLLEATAVTAAVAPPALGTVVAGRGPRAPGSLRGFLLGGLAHVAGLATAAVLLDQDQPWAAGGVLLATDLVVAPWLVVRSIDSAAAGAEGANLGSEPRPALAAIPVRDPAFLR